MLMQNSGGQTDTTASDVTHDKPTPNLSSVLLETYGHEDARGPKEFYCE